MSAGVGTHEESVDGAGRAAASGGVYRWYVLGLLFCGYALCTANQLVVSVVAEPLRKQFHLSDSEQGFLLGMALNLPIAVASLPMGYLLDRYNRKRLLAAVLTLWSLFAASSALAGSYLALVLSRMGVGAAEAGQAPGALSMIADTFAPNRRSTAIGVYYTSVSVGTLFIFVLGGLVLHHFGWRPVFLLAGLPGLAVALLLLTTVKEPARGAHDSAALDAREVSFIRVVSDIFRNAPLLLAILGNVLSTGVQSAVMAWMVSFMARIHHVPVPHAAALCGLINAVFQALATLGAGWLADRYSKGDPAKLAQLPAWASGVALIGGLIFALAPSEPAAWAGLAVLSLGSGGFLGTGFALLIALAAPHVRGSTVSAGKLATKFIGQGFIPLFTGMVSDWVGGAMSLRPAMAATALLFGFAALGFWLSGWLAGRAGASSRV